ncbi:MULTISPECIES: inositol monophosphatase [unclassified Actinomyces]|uniref:inositol monophosphatase family protein n=1 Tax=unclassified Actinomyces TaxID=2609248 RepID=UPI0020171DCA|nr:MULTISPECIES: inositol monophosphatase [unclassified Actinomyces]MCL3777095.1 inositol monophosphatase [Actinomyces sp. AC-20-1]MCL3789893.1 inositol monophosphatase [Actinomyces sp. 187325]MCL3792583.1 inositol monophosphatase [Actinomyces sp. 186855]MCL3794759.1 inositol monophosphatase [Actinomyces sp. 217892]
MTASSISATGAEPGLEDLLALAVSVVEEGAAIAREAGGDLQVSTKSNRNDLVTAVDRCVEEHIAGRLLSGTGYPLLGEEGHDVDTWNGRVWVLDPIDGTMNYVETHRDYAISLALCEDGAPVLAVVMDVVACCCYTALRGGGAWCDGEELSPVLDDRGYRDAVIITDLKEMRALPRLARCLEESRGHRRYGSAALECVEVAAGRAGAFVHMWVSPWDIAAASLICSELGVVFTRLDGTPLDLRWKGSVLAAPGRIHDELLRRLMIDAQ